MANDRQAEQQLEVVRGCFSAAEVEGLSIALAETTDERLKDLVERRLMHALYAADDQGDEATGAPTQAEPSADTGLTDEQLGAIAHSSFDGYWAEDCYGSDTEAWIRSAKAVVAADRAALKSAQPSAPAAVPHRELRFALKEAIDTMEAEIDSRGNEENVRRMKRATAILKNFLAAPSQPSSQAPATDEGEAFGAWWPTVGQTIGRVAAWAAWQARATLASQPSAESIHLQDLNKALANAMELRQQLDLVKQQQAGEVWLWDPSGPNDLASMGNRMGVLIHACDLRSVFEATHPQFTPAKNASSA